MHPTTRLLLAAATSSLIASIAVADEPFTYEGFEYGSTPNMQFANGGIGWSSKWNKLIRVPVDSRAPLNRDGTVDGADLGVLLANWGAVGSAADLNGDGVVDGGGLGVLLASWGSC
ncbi:MAG: hypothetical protein U0575_00480 [Phycisphaerales bacterium]|jgi:hypothetical protein